MRKEAAIKGAMGRVREVDYAGLRLDSFVCACVVSVGVNPCNVCVIEHRLDFDCLTVPLLHANFTPPSHRIKASHNRNTTSRFENSLVGVQSGVGNG